MTASPSFVRRALRIARSFHTVSKPAVFGVILVAAAATAAAAEGIVTRGHPGDATCLAGADLPKDRSKELERLADRTWDLLRKQKTDELWELAGPPTGSLKKLTFAADMIGISERMGTHNKKKPDEIYSVTFEGTYAGAVICGDKEQSSPAHRAIRLKSDGEAIAVVFRPADQPPFERIVAFTLRERDGRWTLSGVHATAVTFHGRNWKHYRDDTERFHPENTLARLLVLEVAMAFSQPAPFVTTRESYLVNEKVQELLTGAGAITSLTLWPIDGHDVSIQRVTVTTTRDALRPHVTYVSKYKLDSKEAAAEAAAVGSYIRRRHHELEEYFADVLLEAVEKPLKELEPGFTSRRTIESLKDE